MSNLEIRPGDRIHIHHPKVGYVSAWVLHKYWWFGWKLKVVTHQTQDHLTIPIKCVQYIIQRNDIGR